MPATSDTPPRTLGGVVLPDAHSGDLFPTDGFDGRVPVEELVAVVAHHAGRGRAGDR